MLRTIATPASRRRRSPNRRALVVDRLEDRRLLSQTYTVTTTADHTEQGTLRWAINQANSNGSDTAADPDRINFDIRSEAISGSWTIAPKTPLPTITHPVFIDGASQPTASIASPVIRISGESLYVPGNGLTLATGADSSTILALMIAGFSQGHGIAIASSNSNRIIGNQIVGNFDGNGIDVTGGGNLIEGNQIDGNRFGISVRGAGSAGNTIGGTAVGAGNSIASNFFDGIEIVGSTGNSVAGNLIGLRADRSAASNGRYGIALTSSANFNAIGGAEAAARNVISGLSTGVSIIDSLDNSVLGNYVGTSADGNSSLGNKIGVFLGGGSGNTIGGAGAGAGNVISGLSTGVSIENSPRSLVQGNSIGTSASGNASLGNVIGIFLGRGSDNTIGGAAGAGNVISGNSTGISIEDSPRNLFQGNSIGTTADGKSPLRNDTGIFLSGGSGNTIGGTVDTRNIISGNGIGISFYDTSRNFVQGNFIGTDRDGVSALGNGTGVLLSGGSGNTIGAGNVISGNEIGISLVNSSLNSVPGNDIGTTAGGGGSLGNGIGIFLSGGSGNTIGGGDGAPNVISGNGIGIQVSERTSSSNTIRGNLIGTNRDGTRTIGGPGETVGILIDDAIGTIIGPDNVIGGFTAGINIVGANASGNQVRGNYIGTNKAGAAGLGNQVGVYINRAQDNVIGGTSAGDRNYISGNTQAGVYIYGIPSTGNQVVGNTIGLAPDGVTPFRSNKKGRAFLQDVGVAILDASRNTVGGTSRAAGNILTGNETAGVYVLGRLGPAADNVIENNRIGLNATGRRGVGNNLYGVLLFNAPRNTVVRRGPMANRFGGNHIANVREFTGPENSGDALRPRRPRTKVKPQVQWSRQRPLASASLVAGPLAAISRPASGAGPSPLETSRSGH